jgi:GNAT superfamily N-acetyltransferase
MSSLNFVIRDAVAEDIAPCMALDHTYETDYVWQMSITPESNARQIRFSKERLPRAIEIEYNVTEAQLHAALADDVCFVVVVGKDDRGTMLGYLVMRVDPTHHLGMVQALVVARPLRRHKIGKRLLTIARRWAKEHDARHIMVETQTKNYPAIEFCQQNGLSFCGYNDQYFRNHDIALFFGQSLR